jgi:hypothetical protein
MFGSISGFFGVRHICNAWGLPSLREAGRTHA